MLEFESMRRMEWHWGRMFKGLGMVLALWLLGWTVYTFAASEQTQMLRVQTKFIKALEQRKWSKVEAMICKDYADEWGQGPDELKATMKQLLGGFFVLSLDQAVVSSRATKGLGYVRAIIKVEGNGAGLSSVVMTAANRVKQPWFFHWHKRGFWPWSWELVQIHNEELRHVSVGAER